MAFVHYRSPVVRPGHLGESLRTRRTVDAWARIRRFLAECTDNPPPRSVTLRVDRAVDDDGRAAALAEELSRDLGPSAEWRSTASEEHGWEWSVPMLLDEVVARCAQHETRPRIHVNAAVRRHGAPQTPQVWASIAYEITMQCGVPDTHSYQPGWGQSQLRAYLGYNEVWLVLHLPFAQHGPELEAAVTSIEAALDLSLSRKRLALHTR